jgi:adenylate/guanylate cyclase family protein
MVAYKRPRKAWYQNLEGVTADGDFSATFHLKRPQPAIIALLASGYAPVYPCHAFRGLLRFVGIFVGSLVTFLLSLWFFVDMVRSRADEEGTLERLKALRRELLDPKIAEHRGRIVKTTGDGMLVEFPSVVDAVRCAVAVQQAMPERNTGIAADNRIELRIGINLGDVIIEGDDLSGDGVNIAARIEALADAGKKNLPAPIIHIGRSSNG